MKCQTVKYCLVPKEELIELLKANDKLETLEYHGVDNWGDYCESLWDDIDSIYDDGESFRKKEESDYFEKLADKKYKQFEI